ncbi:MAG: hypothetical protein COV67_03245 [Nitrospinae bacterium CG11_big_fil_rev_8_21_14_0_20_56_8]|nr:MAG: hypothetical protein COV67_03245 [Nitrospinae bacterium CG11_big_fil_rev_8_21_14_0_20_56_8]
MKVVRNFSKIYREESDPWNIGNARSGRYDFYFDQIQSHARSRNSLLDIGCGFGAFLSRFQGNFQNLTGVEVAAEAISKGQSRYPFIRFVQASADSLRQTPLDRESFDTIIYSDVIYYLDEASKVRSLEWISGHLSPGGIAFISAWCPGKNYLEFEELQRMVEQCFAVERQFRLESGHGVFLARRKRHLVAVTVDYETWHPVPEGKSIDWTTDIFDPMNRLLELFDERNLKLTIFAEMGEYFWLKANDAAIAEKMESQWKQAVAGGHDVQLHLHPNWLPELGARHKDGQWIWDWSRSRLADYPGDIVALIGKCKLTLEALLSDARDDYRVTCYRAGAYQAQPFRAISEALVHHGIVCDSSVYRGGRSEERGYDYTLACSDHQPHFANRFDPQLKAPPAEQGIVELPIFTFAPDRRWFLDGEEGRRFAQHLLGFLETRRRAQSSTETHRFRRKLQSMAGQLYSALRPLRRGVNRILPRSFAHFIPSYEPERLAGHEYFVMIGHTKGNLQFDGIADNLDRLRDDGRFEFITLSEMAETARPDLLSRMRADADDEARFQVRREYGSIMGESRNEAQSFRLQEMIPLDRATILDLGCGSGYWTDRIARLYPWTQVVGADCGEEFIAKARDRYASDRASFQVEHFERLSFQDGSFDCVYADNVLEHAWDVDRVLEEIHRILRPGGVLIAALPSDARNPGLACDNHTWKTAPHEVRLRLEDRGFAPVFTEEVDTFKECGMPPYPPALDRMIYLRAWKSMDGGFFLARALDAMQWTYNRLDPAQPTEGSDPVRIISGGHAWCWGYAVVLGTILQREGYPVQWITMVAQNHPRGRGPLLEDSHEVIQIGFPGGRPAILDPTCNIHFPCGIEDLLRAPVLANIPRMEDLRYKQRRYDLYSTSSWYGRVKEYAARNDPKEKLRLQPAPPPDPDGN